MYFSGYLKGLAAFLMLAAAVLQFSAAASAQQQVRVDEEIGYWKVICETPPGARSEQCGIFQSVQDSERADFFLSITLLRPADRKGDLLRIQAPLGILLPTGIGLEIDGNDMGTAFFVRCLPDGCWADVNVDEKLLKTLMSGKRAIFKLFPTPEQGIGLPVELQGLSEAYAKLS